MSDLLTPLEIETVGMIGKVWGNLCEIPCPRHPASRHVTSRRPHLPRPVPAPRRVVRCPRRIAVRTSQRPTPSLTQPVLTERQLEVLQLVANGWTQVLIADKFGITREAANGHMDNVRLRLGAATAAHAVAIAYQRGILRTGEDTVDDLLRRLVAARQREQAPRGGRKETTCPE